MATRQARTTANPILASKCVLIECMEELPRAQLRLLVVYSGMAVGVDRETVAVHII